MKERPILFSGPMVKAILDGRKTQTRRTVKPQPPENWGTNEIKVETFTPVVIKRGEEVEGEEIFGAYDIYGEWGVKCPYGQPGDRLWVRETWASNHIGWGFASTKELCKIKPKIHDLQNFTVYRADGDWKDQFEQVEGSCPPWRPSIHMPRWASRINLEITNVRIQRLEDLSEEDAKKEGASPCGNDIICTDQEYHHGFEILWREINGDKSWEENPLVWVIEFKRVT